MKKAKKAILDVYIIVQGPCRYSNITI
jgi:hypothetical protein